MEIRNPLYVSTREQWRAWLEKYHDRETEVWLIYYKKGSAQARIPYDDAVEEALCYGWIDSTVKSIDEEKYAQRFTPRKPGSKWSELNRRRVRRLIAEGRMTEAGLAKVDLAQLELEPSPEHTEATETLPVDLERELRANSEAWKNFVGLAPSYRRMYVRWILDAKREETRARRLREAITRLEANEKPGMM